MSKKVFLSGIQPSGKPHIGNYFGMMKQLLGQPEDYEVYVLIVDYHAMKSVRDSKEMKENIIAVVLDYLALGLDPNKVTFFKQSDVSEHTELCWIFDTITTMPYLMRAHAFKDAEAKNNCTRYSFEIQQHLRRNFQTTRSHDYERSSNNSGHRRAENV
ncbi:MAG: Tryptophan-tRNA ligase [Candidatus Nomurabacteria bacterium GW2011_GWA2_40_97]|nr:MAG: Tryptophan-tRNA ligase [Candidatus Nomurabacteria bacterium GW2011_GWA2_40_97]